MKKYLITFIIIITAALVAAAVIIHKSPNKNKSFSGHSVDQALSPFQKLSKATITEIIETVVDENPRFSRITQTLKATITNGSEKGKEVEASFDEQLTNAKTQTLKVDDKIIIGKLTDDTGDTYVIADRYRLPSLLWFAAGFIVLAFILGRRHSMTALIGLAASIAILIYFVAPNILQGKDASTIGLISAGLIAIISTFLAHGFKDKILLAATGSVITLSIATALAVLATHAIKLFGNGSENAYFLQAGLLGGTSPQGLLLAGMLIATVGVLDDITTAQAAAVEEIYAANSKVTFTDLYTKGSSIGREHIASLINTLVLTYAGASLPLFILFTTTSTPLWAILSSELIAEEIVRTLVGSTALILAVPITTALTAYYFTHTKNPLPQ